MPTRMIATILTIVPLSLAACSSGDDGTALATLTGTSGVAAVGDGQVAVDADEALLAFAECMREQGVDMPDPEVNADGRVSFGLRANTDDGEPPQFDRGELEAMMAAREECQHLLEGVELGVGPRGDRPEFDSEAFLAFAECMREQGINDFPDPDADGRLSMEAMQALDMQSEEFQAAAEACSDDSEGGFRFGGGGPGGPSGPGGGPRGGQAGTSGSTTTDGN